MNRSGSQIIKTVAQLDHRSFITHIAKHCGPESFLEVGVREGDSTKAAVEGGWLSLKKLILCDSWGLHHGGTGRGNHGHIENMLIQFTGETEFLDGLSHKMIPGVALNSVDMTHVDADHSTAGALSDLRLVWPRTKKVMVVHDIFMPPVWLAVSTFLSEKKSEIHSIEMSVEDSGTIAVWRAF